MMINRQNKSFSILIKDFHKQINQPFIKKKKKKRFVHLTFLIYLLIIDLLI